MLQFDLRTKHKCSELLLVGVVVQVVAVTLVHLLVLPFLFSPYAYALLGLKLPAPVLYMIKFIYD